MRTKWWSQISQGLAMVAVAVGTLIASDFRGAAFAASEDRPTTNQLMDPRDVEIVNYIRQQMLNDERILGSTLDDVRISSLAGKVVVKGMARTVLEERAILEHAIGAVGETNVNNMLAVIPAEEDERNLENRTRL